MYSYLCQVEFHYLDAALNDYDDGIGNNWLSNNIFLTRYDIMVKELIWKSKLALRKFNSKNSLLPYLSELFSLMAQLF